MRRLEVHLPGPLVRSILRKNSLRREEPIKPDGSWHHLKVKVIPPRGLPRLFVRSKEGYYALTNVR